MKIRPQISNGKYIHKGWGHELHIENNQDYCAKLLIFHRGKKFSMHYHLDKYETWYVREGEFNFTWIDPTDASRVTERLKSSPLIKSVLVSVSVGVNVAIIFIYLFVI